MKKWKINWRWIMYPSVGLIVSGIASTTYFAIDNLIKNDNDKIKFEISKGDIYQYNFKGDLVHEKNNLDNQIALKFKVVDNDEKYSFISNEVLDKVAKKIISRGIFGPELGSLKSIVFNDKNLTSNKNSNGIYIPATKEIGINTQWINSYLYSKDILPNHYITKDLWIEIKSEWIFEVLFHEYGHHIFSTYSETPYTSKVFSTYFKTNNKKTNKWTIQENKWNDFFIKKFMNLFTYDDKNSLPLERSYQETINLANLKTLPIGAKFSAYSMFKEANLVKKIPTEKNKLKELNDKWNKNYLNYSIHNLKKNSWIKSNMNFKENYLYLYSLEELLTRKLLLAAAPFSYESWWYINKYGIVPYDLVYDFSNSVSLENNQIIGDKTYPSKIPKNSKVFMNDYVFSSNNNRSEKYLKIIDEMIGHKNNNNISHVWYRNNYYVNSGDSIAEDQNKERTNFNMIKFGGYTDKPYKYIGYIKDGHFKALEITSYPFKIRYKESLFSGYIQNEDTRRELIYYKKDKDGNILIKNNQKEIDHNLSRLKYSYYLKSWINIKDIKDQVLYFSNYKNGLWRKPLSGIRTDEQGGTTTFSKWGGTSLTNQNIKIYKAKYGIEPLDNESGLMIGDAGLFKDGVSKRQ